MSALVVAGALMTGPAADARKKSKLPPARMAVAMLRTAQGNEVGRVTSGGFSPSLQRPIGMGYVATALSAPGTPLTLEQRGKLFTAEVVPMPFVPHRYHRKKG